MVIFRFLIILNLLMIAYLSNSQEQFSFFTKNGAIVIQKANETEATILIEKDSILISAIINGNHLDSQLNKYESYHAVLSNDWTQLTLFHIQRGNYRIDTVRIDGMIIPPIKKHLFETEWGILTIEIQGTQLTGEYPWYNGKIMGELIENQFQGIWLQANRGFGTLEAKFDENFSSFKGKYNDYNFHPEEWYNWNGTLIIEAEKH